MGALHDWPSGWQAAFLEIYDEGKSPEAIDPKIEALPSESDSPQLTVVHRILLALDDLSQRKPEAVTGRRLGYLRPYAHQLQDMLGVALEFGLR